MGRVERAKTILHAVLPPIVVSAARRVRRRFRLRTAFPSQAPRLNDGVVELRLIDRCDLEMIERAARDPEISRRFALLKARPDEYFERYLRLLRDGTGAAFAICDVG